MSAVDWHQAALPDAGSGSASSTPFSGFFVMVEVVMAVDIEARDLHGLPVLVICFVGEDIRSSS